jgi:hypothetical protein
MSWDIFVQDWPADAKTIMDIPDDYSPAPIGQRSEIIGGIKEVVPHVDFSDPSWGYIRGTDYSIEVNLGNEEVVRGFAFHVRGSNTSIGVISDILRHLHLRAIADGEFFEPAHAAESLECWRNYRDQIVINPRSNA